jgi:hypothetical protein
MTCNRMGTEEKVFVPANPMKQTAWRLLLKAYQNIAQMDDNDLEDFMHTLRKYGIEGKYMKNSQLRRKIARLRKEGRLSETVPLHTELALNELKLAMFTEGQVLNIWGKDENGD